MTKSAKSAHEVMGGTSESVVQVPGWKSLPWLRHGFSARLGGVSTVYQSAENASKDGGGDLNTGWTAADDPAHVTENRRRLIAAIGDDVAAGSLVTVRQVHSARSLVVSGDTREFFNTDGRAALEADGLMTDIAGPVLGIQTADCVPVLVVDPARCVVAALHAGWRGTVAAIVEDGVAQMVAEFGSRPEDLLAAIGPSIGACCYTVGEEVRERFERRFEYADELFQVRSDGDTGALHVDLWEANRRQLLSAGVLQEKITIVGECSGCSGLPGRRRYFSHRCENGFTGRMMSVIGIAP